jgi:hypothetical protein
MRQEGLSECKIWRTLSGIEPATFRLLAQCLNQLRHRVPLMLFRHSFIHDYDRSMPSSQRFLLTLTSSNSCLRLLPRLPVICILPSICSSITCFRKQFLQDVTNTVSLPSYSLYDIPVLLDSLYCFFSSHAIGPVGLLHPSPAPHFKTFQIFLTYFPKCPSSAPYKAVLYM